MAKLHPSQRKHVQRLKAQARQQRILNIKKNGKPIIPTTILKRLAALNLPPSEFVYTAVLEKLMKEA